MISLIRSPTSVIGPLANWRQKFILVASGPAIRSAAKVSSLCSPPTITIRRFGPWPPLDRKQFDFDHKSLPAKVRFDREQFDHWLQKFLENRQQLDLGGNFFFCPPTMRCLTEVIILIANNSFLDSIQKQHFDRQHFNSIIVFIGENSLRSFPSHGFDLGPAIDFGIFRNSGRGPAIAFRIS